MNELNRDADCEHFCFLPSGGVPNHPWFPLVIYRGVLAESEEFAANRFEELFRIHGWAGSWRNGVFDFHHYHSNVHEVLGVYRGAATVRFGGEGGRDVRISRGDVVVIPAGVGHKALSAENEFAVVGAYPDGESPDLLRESDGIDDEVRERLKKVPCPIFDPIYGSNHRLKEYWQSQNAAD